MLQQLNGYEVQACKTRRNVLVSLFVACQCFRMAGKGPCMALGETILSAFRTLAKEALKEQDIEKLEEFVAAIGDLLHLLERRFADAHEGVRLQ